MRDNVVREPTEKNRTTDAIPDFSWCGYRGGGVALPVAPVRVTLLPTLSGDDGVRIQAALDQVACLPANSDYPKGAVLLERGEFRVAGSLKLPSGVVLRGRGQEARNGTTLLATGKDTRTLLLIGAEGKPIQTKDESSRQPFLEARVPVGVRRLRVKNPRAFRVGENVLIERPATAAWIAAIGMDKIVPRPGAQSATKQWTAGKYDLSFERIVTAVDDTAVTVDAPVVMAMDQRYGGGSICRYQPGRRVTQVGVEHLRLRSEYVVGQETKDDHHCGGGIDFSLAQDCWVHHVTALHFLNGCIATSSDARRLTIEDCATLDPVSPIIPSRRYSFGVRGQQVLVQRCYARGGRHDFMTGYKTCGPNAFVDCLAEDTHADCGPHNGWSTGILYDNITCGQLNIQDRGFMGTGQGWAGANHVLYNCSGIIICQTPPTAENWAIGCTGTRGKEFLKGREPATWVSWGKTVRPRSLYGQQMEARLGPAALVHVTTPEQRRGSLTRALRSRFAEPPYVDR